MRRLYTGIIFLSLFSIFLMGFWGVRSISGLEADKEKIEDKSERKHEISEEKKEIKEDLKAERQKRIANWETLNVINRNLAQKDSQLRVKEKELERKKNQIRITNEILDKTAKDLEDTQENFESRLRAYYKSGPRRIVNLIVDASDLSDLAQRIKYTEYLLRSDGEMIQTIREQRTLLMETNEKLSGEVKEKEQLYNEIWELRSNFSNEKKEKEQLIKKIQKNIRDLEAALAELEREELEIEFFLEAAAKGNLSTNFDGTFSRPLKNYTTSSGFGMRRHPIFRRVRMHNGIDLSAPHGTPVLAAGAGRVIFAGWKNGYGNVVFVDHGKGFATVYAHLSSILVPVGYDLMEGQPLGKVGSTGWSTGNHLHFEIRVNGKAKNPTGYLNF